MVNTRRDQSRHIRLCRRPGRDDGIHLLLDGRVWPARGAGKGGRQGGGIRNDGRAVDPGGIDPNIPGQIAYREHGPGPIADQTARRQQDITVRLLVDANPERLLIFQNLQAGASGGDQHEDQPDNDADDGHPAPGESRLR